MADAEVVDAAAWAIHRTSWGTGASWEELPARVRADRRAEAQAALSAAVGVARARRRAAPATVRGRKRKRGRRG